MHANHERHRFWQAAVADSIGGRKEQQDRVAVFSGPAGKSILAVVADGLGGHLGGAAAAQTVVDIAKAYWDRISKPVEQPETLLLTICLNAHYRIVEQARDNRDDGHSTCALFYADGAGAVALHVGDSRIYRFIGTTLVGRSRDHSVPQLLLDRGEITEAEMATHPDQNRLFQALGSEQDPNPTIERFAAGTFDRVLLCSDGLWEAASPEEMATALAADDLAAGARRLVDLAAAARGSASDNVAAALLRAEGGNRGGRTQRVLPFLIAAALAAGLAAAIMLHYAPSRTTIGGWLRTHVPHFHRVLNPSKPPSRPTSPAEPRP